MLRRRSSGVAENSLHTKGQAHGFLHSRRAARQAPRHRPAGAGRRRRLLSRLRLALRPHGYRQRPPLAAHEPQPARRRVPERRYPACSLGRQGAARLFAGARRLQGAPGARHAGLLGDRQRRPRSRPVSARGDEEIVRDRRRRGAAAPPRARSCRRRLPAPRPTRWRSPSPSPRTTVPPAAGRPAPQLSRARSTACSPASASPPSTSRPPARCGRVPRSISTSPMPLAGSRRSAGRRSPSAMAVRRTAPWRPGL